jgi:pimeloyl-ACP methyl ester carboxylesterase
MPLDTLAVSPLYGFPLSGATKYALLLTNAVKDINDHPIAMPGLMRQALLSGPSTDPVLSRLISVYKPLYDYLKQQKITMDTTGVATVFTTQDPTKDLRTIKQVVSNITGLGISTIGYYPEWDSWTSSYVFGGTYTSPDFQYGTPPYATTGGGFSFDTNGTPVIQRWESLDFSLTVPHGPQPPNGWPIALYAHGTGGSHMSLIVETGSVGGLLASKGIAGICIDQPLHGNRVNPPLSPGDLDMDSFNFFNPDEGRTNFRQSAIDSFVLTRLIKTGGLFITSGISPTGQRITFDTSNVIFVGHSQGGITGTLYAALEPDIKGAVLSGDGGDLSLTILYRESPNIAQPFQLLLGIPLTQPLTTFHPVIGLVQFLVEVSDPINYGPFLIDPYNNSGTPKNIILTEGLLDPYTPSVTAEALAVASGIPLIEPVAHPVEGYSIIGLSTFSPPVSNDVTASNGTQVTAGLLQFPFDDHFAIFTDTTARYKYSVFLQSLVSTGTAVIP